MKFIAKKPDGIKRKPLRTFSEMAAEFGVTSGALVRQLQLHPDGAPKPQLTHRSSETRGRATWYDADAFRKWWKSIPRG